MAISISRSRIYLKNFYIFMSYSYTYNGLGGGVGGGAGGGPGGGNGVPPFP